MYLLRLDDASPHWNKENWHRIHALLQKYNVHPIVAIIPDNKDRQLLHYPEDTSYFNTIRDWIGDGWTPAMHGLHHTPTYRCSGINSVSEFSGASLERQKEDIKTGYAILLDRGIKCSVFVAPYHTFDENTLLAIKEVTDIRIISDTIARDIYCNEGFYFIPQQSGSVRLLPFPLVTFCYHPNVMTDKGFEKLECFLKHHQFTAFQDLQMKKRQLDIWDGLLNRIYWVKHTL